MQPPPKPNESDCCGSGCTPCIFDVYEEQLKRYKTNKPAAVPQQKNCIAATSYTEFLLVERTQHTKNSIVCVFRCENATEGVGLFYNAGQHFLLRGGVNGGFTRAYTPIPPQEDCFSFRVLIKLYDNGLMSRYLKNIILGEKTLWRGPYGEFALNFNYKYILGLAQGTGIAPIYAVFDAITKNEDCDTFLQLFCCYRDSNDFLLHDELYSLAANWNFAYQVFFSCNLTPKTVKYNEKIHSRRLCVEDVQNYLLGKDLFKTQVLICGSKEFSEHWKRVVKGCNVLQENIHVF